MPDPVTAAILSLVAGIVLSYVTLRERIRKELQAKYDASLRELRLDVYKRLWSNLKPLALFGRAGYPNQAQLESLAEALKTWYFDEGGLYMSENTRDAYFRLQRALRALNASSRWQSAGISVLDADSFEHLRLIGSRLRTLLTLDVGTRNPFAFDKAAKDDAAGPSADDRSDPDEGWILKLWAKPALSAGEGSAPT
jgi:hypothetical protein